MRRPFSRSRLISISLSPPSRPAACRTFGRPRTITVVRDDGPEWTIAPARRAACATCFRVFAKMPVNVTWTPDPADANTCFTIRIIATDNANCVTTRDFQIYTVGLPQFIYDEADLPPGNYQPGATPEDFSLITACVEAVLAQRLVRKICEDCRSEFEPSPEMLMELNLRPADVQGKKFYYGKGCQRCNNSGYKGRTGIYELLNVTDDIRDMVTSDASIDDMRNMARTQGMTTLREAGLKLIFDGVTTIDEVVRETVMEDLD